MYFMLLLCSSSLASSGAARIAHSNRTLEGSQHSNSANASQLEQANEPGDSDVGKQSHSGEATQTPGEVNTPIEEDPFNWVNSLPPQMKSLPKPQAEVADAATTLKTFILFTDAPQHYSWVPPRSRSLPSTIPATILSKHFTAKQPYFTLNAALKNAKDMSDGGHRARAELQTEPMLPEEVTQYAFTETLKITEFEMRSYPHNSTWKDGIVIFQIFGDGNPFAEVAWAPGLSKRGTDAPALLVKWGQTGHDGSSSEYLIGQDGKEWEELAKGKVFTVKGYFEQDKFYFEVMSAHGQQLGQRIGAGDHSFTLPPGKYHFASGLYLQQDGTGEDDAGKASMNIYRQSLMLASKQSDGAHTFSSKNNEVSQLGARHDLPTDDSLSIPTIFSWGYMVLLILPYL